MPTTPRQELYKLACKLAAGLSDEPELQAKAYQLVHALKPCRHGKDFAVVIWFGQRHPFSPAQGAAVKVLWEAWEDGICDVRQETILDAIGSDTRRLSNLFKDHPAWGTMIVPSKDTKGAYRLAESPDLACPTAKDTVLDTPTPQRRS